jgi:integrase
MGTIQRRDTNKGPATYQARIRRKGHSQLSASFPTLELAAEWVCQTEKEFDAHEAVLAKDRARAKLAETKNPLDLPFGYFMERYLVQVTPFKRSGVQESIRVKAFMRTELAAYTLRELTPQVLSAWCDARLLTVKGGTVNRDLGVISDIFGAIRKKWFIPLAKNPVSDIQKPKGNPGRDRRLLRGEEELILEEAGRGKGGFLRAVIVVAIETAMRQGEIIQMEWQHVHLQERYVHLPITKNGSPRNVPLSSKAIAIIKSLAIIELTPDRAGPVFPGVTGEAIKRAFQNMCKRARVNDLHFHDLRHEAASRLSEKNLSLLEISAITGHKSLTMLKRYTHLDASKLAEKLG